MKIIIGITGASGSIYAKNLIEILKKENFEISLVFTENGKKVWNYELPNYPISQLNLKIYDNNNLFAPFASGNSDYDALIIVPCSMGTLAKIANGISENLITRTADVMLKENKKLILVPREMPINIIHVENFKKILLAGGKIIPASPSFYSNPQNINDLVNTVIQKILNQLNVKTTLIKWQPKKTIS